MYSSIEIYSINLFISSFSSSKFSFDSSYVIWDSRKEEEKSDDEKERDRFGRLSSNINLHILLLWNC